MTYELDIKVVLKGIEPFTTVISVLIVFLKTLIEKDLISGYLIEVMK